jgi:3',5'-cyclic-AMP phosphodiesterase
VPGRAHGELDEATLEFLRCELASPAPEGTLVALHHPPIPSPVEPISRLRLRNAQALGEAIAGSDVRLILCGHYHHVSLGALAGVPVWVSPAVSDGPTSRAATSCGWSPAARSRDRAERERARRLRDPA